MLELFIPPLVSGDAFCLEDKRGIVRFRKVIRVQFSNNSGLLSCTQMSTVYTISITIEKAISMSL